MLKLLSFEELVLLDSAILSNNPKRFLETIIKVYRYSNVTITFQAKNALAYL